MPDDPTPEILDAAALAVDLATGGPGGSLAAIPLKAVWSLTQRIEQRKVRKALAMLIESLATAGDLPPDEAATRIQGLLAGGSDREDDLLYAAFRSMAYSRSDAAWPYIARLAAGYLHHGQPADSFFKRVSWLLERAEEPDMAILREAVDHTHHVLTFAQEGLKDRPDLALQGVAWRYSQPAGGRPLKMKINAIIPVPSGERGPRTTARTIQDNPALMDFKTLFNESRLGVPGPNHVVTFDKEAPALLGLLRLFG